MDLAKPRVDIGMSTNTLDDVLAFWQGEAGTPFDHLLRIRRGQDQHRHDANGSVLKINAYADVHIKRDKDIMTRYDDRHERIYTGRTDSGGSR